jgi:prepilin signal peptidase PulO-like enzyme (type II secretory pathway)
MNIVLFALGIVVGSFVNVVTLRYDPDRPLFDQRVVGGRSRCPKCGGQLRWFELVPLASYLLQGGKCLRCKKFISPQYLVGEVLCGLMFVLVGSRPAGGLLFPWYDAQPIAMGFWFAVFLTLFLIMRIDVRTMIIPDELNIALASLGFFIAGMSGDFLAHVGAAIGAGGAFLVLVLATRGRGMGVGDVKLAAGLGLVFGWPAVALVCAGGFIIGAAYGIVALALRTKKLSSAVPFAPFLAVAAFVVFLSGDLVQYAAFFAVAELW